jgi:hypothetical protein
MADDTRDASTPHDAGATAPMTEDTSTGDSDTHAAGTGAANAENTSATSDDSGADVGADESTGTSGGGRASTSDGRTDLKGIFRQLTAPMVESFDTRLRDQVETHVDELLGPKVEAAIADRLRTVDRAIASLSRTVDDLERRVALLEGDGESLDDV